MFTAYEVISINPKGVMITKRIFTDYINACNYFDKICKKYNVPVMTEEEYMYNNAVSRTLDTNQDLKLHEVNIYEKYDTV